MVILNQLYKTNFLSLPILPRVISVSYTLHPNIFTNVSCLPPTRDSPSKMHTGFDPVECNPQPPLFPARHV